MAHHSTQFEPTDTGMVLTNAILLYRNSGNRRFGGGSGPAFASIHAVEEQGGRPTIAAGSPLTRAQLRHWTAALDKAAAPEILPGNVLVAHPEMLVWWVPEQVRQSYFALTSPPAGLKALAERTSVPLPYPAHLFMADRSGLRVYALPVSERPSATTELLHSPVLNVFIDGRLCWGNIAKPKAHNVAAMAEYEQAVFDSWSTHPNPGQEATVTGKGGLVRLWDDLAARGVKRFPTQRLKPFHTKGAGGRKTAPITLGQLVAEAARK